MAGGGNTSNLLKATCMLRKPKRKVRYPSDLEPVCPTNLVLIRNSHYYAYYQNPDDGDIWIEQIRHIPYRSGHKGPKNAR